MTGERTGAMNSSNSDSGLISKGAGLAVGLGERGGGGREDKRQPSAIIRLHLDVSHLVSPLCQLPWIPSNLKVRGLCKRLCACVTIT